MNHKATATNPPQNPDSSSGAQALSKVLKGWLGRSESASAANPMAKVMQTPTHATLRNQGPTRKI